MILANWERFLVKARCPKNYDGCKHTGIYSIINCRISHSVIDFCKLQPQKMSCNYSIFPCVRNRRRKAILRL
ncbi:Uncharacterized protein APZ42_001695 [Daphnia magna]|uniref:Uncharacterized protein n=1 Tax=Daphnia magna TaxID=35525 RepID=A0A164ITK2_9CRUS|nr:Uncharacterized protein APZ42_001695 [Daphnia magna]